MHGHKNYSTAHASTVKTQDIEKRIQAFYICFKMVISGAWLSILGLPAEEEELTPTPVAWPGAASPLEDTGFKFSPEN